MSNPPVLPQPGEYWIRKKNVVRILIIETQKGPNYVAYRNTETGRRSEAKRPLFLERYYRDPNQRSP